MPVDVPKEPKKYTTVYDNFKGVDYTNDASNVYRRRSPSGLNMLPDLDGRPHKRTGWEVKVKADEYRTHTETFTGDGVETVFDTQQSIDELLSVLVDGVETEAEFSQNHVTFDTAPDNGAEIVIKYLDTTELTPGRTYHFSYGGHDFLMIINSCGVFYMSDNELEMHRATRWNADDEQEDVFPPKDYRSVGGIMRLVQLRADENRAFFFEGNGKAGFYVFVENTLWRFGDDGQGLMFYHIEPTIPLTIIGASPTTGAGDFLQAINLLTDKRTVEYFGDGVTKKYKTLFPIKSEATTTVQILIDGNWVDIPHDDNPQDRTAYPWDVQESPQINELNFTTNAPPYATEGNVRITYEPADGASYILTNDYQTKKVSVTYEEVVTRERTRTYYKEYKYNKNKKKYVLSRQYAGTPSAWSVKSTGRGKNPAKIIAPGVYGDFQVWSNHTGTDARVSANYTANWDAYSSSAEITINDDTIAQSGTAKTSTGSWANWVPVPIGRISAILSGGTASYTDTYLQKQTQTITKTKTFNIWCKYTKSDVLETNPEAVTDKAAFMQCRKVLTFGNNIYNQVFVSASTYNEASNKVWFSAANRPEYFPDTNFIEVGADDRAVMGLQKIGSYLGVIKMGSGTDASVYLAYPTTFEEDTTYAVKQSVAGIGAISTGAFNILNEEPLFLSERGVMGINIAESDIGKQIRNRSYYINKKLLAEENLSSAISYVYDGMYYLAINGHCYVLDGSQKSSWENEKTNLQYECYYLENIPAQCFAGFNGDLYFTDFACNLCRFKKDGESLAYVDDYSDHTGWSTAESPIEGPDGKLRYNLDDLAGTSGEDFYLTDENGDYLGDEDEEFNRFVILGGTANINETIVDADNNYYTVMDLEEDEDTGEVKAIVAEGVPIRSVWSTIADDDGMVHFFKNLTKKGFVLSFIPESNNGVEISLKPDEKEPIVIGTMNIEDTTLPYDMFVRKKVKKYKRLQIICANESYNDNFGVDQIIKSYTVGNYSKNRR